jgi:hypothetical protein
MSDWTEVLKQLDAVTEECRSAECFEPFFRGQSDASWPLIPSLGRRDFDAGFENGVYYDFMTFGAPHLGAGFTDWDILFAMQHYGLPTRLLDWSNSASVALYFALVTWTSSACAAIWVLDPYKLNKQAMSLIGIWHTRDLPHTYTEYFIEDDPRKKAFPGKIAAILPSKNNSRLLAQRGTFTLHAELSEGLEFLFPSCIKKIEIPASAIDEGRKFLRLAGRDRYALFPDLQGLSEWLNESYEVDKTPLRVRSKSAGV